ncbi:MAG: NAD(P) transhydrogenase subunit alpha [Oscillospiraceae bacterium]|nr:NAD(P) transhydrogenase subunit alpha [Oscillospiraceae bacterium]
MSEIVLLFFIFVIAAFLGKELISKVPSQLHTPLMSATNAISGIAILGGLLVCSISPAWSPSMILGFFAIICASINVVGGYMVTNRMLSMFKKKEGKAK